MARALIHASIARDLRGLTWASWRNGGDGGEEEGGKTVAGGVAQIQIERSFGELGGGLKIDGSEVHLGEGPSELVGRLPCSWSDETVSHRVLSALVLVSSSIFARRCQER